MHAYFLFIYKNSSLHKIRIRFKINIHVIMCPVHMVDVEYLIELYFTICFIENISSKHSNNIGSNTAPGFKIYVCKAIFPEIKIAKFM